MNVRKRPNTAEQRLDRLITSPANPRIKAIRSLRTRRERDRTGLFFIEGYHITAEALELGATVEQLIIAPDLLPTEVQTLAAQLRRTGVDCLEVSAPVFESISSRDGPQGIGAVLRQRWMPLAQCVGAGRWVALEAVQYPGNLGTILRTCDATGCTGVILLGEATDPYDPVAVRASTGAVISQTLVRASQAEFATWARRHQMLVVGTSPAATASYQEVRYRDPLVVCMGSERGGLSPAQQALCDMVVRIPMAGRRDSLNVAVATAVMLYAIVAGQPPPQGR